ncbi:hypothetical protein AVEN_264611-1 [Araneus ventricosus]|uniref:Gustatory receptor n=1 Tax=Araneus ventricosus TaxID=182803 RepID=A0A4Y2FPH6_ARAVE|nr:hypothetical protein AVEN_264611-1 [Araneus ventricosus]
MFSESGSVIDRTNRLIPRFLRLILCYTGLVKASDINVGYGRISVVFVIILLFVNVDNWILLFTQWNLSYSLKANVAYVATYFLAAWAWFAVYLKKKQLDDLLMKLKKITVSVEGEKINFLVLILCCMPIAISTTVTILVIRMDFAYFSYGCKIKNLLAKILLVSLKNILNTIVFPTFTNIMAVFYCVISLILKSEIKQVTRDIQNCRYEDFSESKRIEILRRKSRINDALRCTEDIFSQPSFIIIAADLLISFSILSMYLDSKFLMVEGLSIYAEWILYAINCLGSVIFILWTAGGIPVVESEFKEAFHEKMSSRMLLIGISENLKLEKWFFVKQDHVLTGWGVLSYRRSSIFAVFGTLITYTVLIVNK